MIKRFKISDLILLTTFSGLLFATLRLERPIAQASVVCLLFFGFHLSLARRLNCYESVFAGAVAAFLTGTFIPHASGSWSFSSDWLRMFIDPLTLVRWVAMMAVGGFVQFYYARVRREQETAFLSD